MKHDVTIKYLDELLKSIKNRDIYTINNEGLNSHLQMLDSLATNYDLNTYGMLISVSEVQDMFKKDREKLEKLNPKGLAYMHQTEKGNIVAISRSNLEDIIRKTRKELKTK